MRWTDATWKARKHDTWIDQPTSMRHPRAAAETLLERECNVQNSSVGAIVVGNQVLFEVEEVTAHRTRLGKDQWLVRWAGYEGDEREFTWEPTKHIPTEFIDDFKERRFAEKPRFNG